MQLYLIISEKLVEDGAPQLNLKSLFGFTSSRGKGLKLSPVFCGAVGWGLLDLRVMILGLAVLEVLSTSGWVISDVHLWVSLGNCSDTSGLLFGFC